MKKKDSPSEEVIVMEAEEMPLEKVIDNALVKENITDKVINGLKEKYGGMRLSSIDNKSEYLEIKEAKREVRKWGILTEKITKKGREEAVRVQKLWLNKEREILAKIAEVEDPLQKEIDRYEAEQTRLEQQEIQRKENAYMQRQSSLLKLGANYANGCIILEDVTYDTDTIKQAEDDFFNDVILPKYQRKYEIKESARIIEEKRREEEAEKMRLEREALEKEKAEMEKARKQLQAEKDESDRLRREEENRIDEAKRKVENERLQQLMKVVPYDQVNKEWLVDEIVFNKILSEKTIEFEAKQKEDEEKRLAQIEIDKKIASDEAVRKEKERVENERIALEQKRIREQQEEAERLTQASDKTKWLNFIEYLNAAPNFGMKSPSYKTKAESANSYLKKIKEL